MPSESSDQVYLVSLSNGDAQCNCSDFRDRQKFCKHIFAVLWMMQADFAQAHQSMK
ncbi:SWIM zinc finger family protein [SAR202 cluster bacterium AD-804-J14_MRT_500m]|nr:SWIM zinc finger family protein [SAR202 cluster bacterium AD-804-J14_MRT_500m]